jgi:dihydroneopterin aldolase
LQHEKDYGQEFLIDISLDVDAGLEDNIQSTVSYAAIADIATEICGRTRFDLIESLAASLVRAVLNYDPRILRTTVTVHKPSAPLTQKFKDVSVTLAGTRDEN